MVSVVIPMYNSAGTIERVLDSVLAQTRFDFIREILVVDDGSQDRSRALVQQYMQQHPEANIQLISKENGGASSARNEGIRRASGTFIALLDSDDLWFPEKIEVQMEAFRTHPDMVFLGCGYREGAFRIGFKKITELYNASIQDLCIRNFPVSPSVVFRRSAVETVGYFDETQKYCEDINYYQRFCTQYNYYYDPRKLVEIGFQKQYFGQMGLSSNLKGMHDGSLKNIRELREQQEISGSFYLLMRVFYQVKYYLRYVKRWLRKK